MVNDLNGNYQEWLKKAEEDELSVRALVDAKKGSPSTICFLSQQVVEKLLKGLLVFNNRPFPKVHDRLELESLLISIEPEIKNYEKDLDFLSTYYSETRYPGDYPEFTWKNAKEAFDAVEKIKKFVLAKIEKSGSGHTNGSVQ